VECSWLPLLNFSHSSEKEGDPLNAFSVPRYIQCITVLAGLLLSWQYGGWLSMVKLFRKYFSLIVPVSFVFCNNFENDYNHGNAL